MSVPPGPGPARARPRQVAPSRTSPRKVAANAPAPQATGQPSTAAAGILSGALGPAAGGGADAAPAPAEIEEGASKMRWTRVDEENLAEWLCKRDKSGLARNLALFISHKNDACLRMIKELRLADQHPTLAELLKGQQKLAAKRVGDKVSKMIERYNSVVQQLSTTGGGIGGVGEDEENALFKGANGRKGETIQAYVERTCHWYYTLEDDMATKSNVRPPVVASSAGLAQQPRAVPENSDADLEAYGDANSAQRILDADFPVPDQGGDLEQGDEALGSPAAAGEERGQPQQKGKEREISGSQHPEKSQDGQESQKGPTIKTPSSSRGPVLNKRPGPNPLSTPSKSSSIADVIVSLDANRTKNQQERERVAMDRDRAALLEAAEAKKAAEAVEKTKWSGDQALRWAEHEAEKKEREKEREDRRMELEAKETRRETEMRWERHRRDEQREADRLRREEEREDQKARREEEKEERREEREERREERRQQDKERAEERALERKRLRLEMFRAQSATNAPLVNPFGAHGSAGPQQQWGPPPPWLAQVLSGGPPQWQSALSNPGQGSMSSSRPEPGARIDPSRPEG
ncbi:unnamed protein product [Tilletia controversa]|nr:unnamed protein product [Tilletia controversa]